MKAKMPGMPGFFLLLFQLMNVSGWFVSPPRSNGGRSIRAVSTPVPVRAVNPVPLRVSKGDDLFPDDDEEEPDELWWATKDSETRNMIVKDTISNASDDVSDIVASMQTFEPLEWDDDVEYLTDSFGINPSYLETFENIRIAGEWISPSDDPFAEDEEDKALRIRFENNPGIDIPWRRGFNPPSDALADVESMSLIQHQEIIDSPNSESAEANVETDSNPVSTVHESPQELEDGLDHLILLNRLTTLQMDKVVEYIAAMEASYPESSSPLEDPSLDGEWSLVYASRGWVVRRMLKGLLAVLFQTSEAQQVVDSASAVVINACRMKLLHIPGLCFLLIQRGTFKPTSKRKLTVQVPRSNKGRLRGFLLALRHGRTEAEITYLSERWRICRIGEERVAFRKNEY